MGNAALVDCERLYHNIRRIRCVLPKECRIAAVVKGDAYGHGIIGISRIFDKHPDIYMLVTASFKEAMDLLDAGIKKPVLILNRELPWDLEEYLVTGDEKRRKAVEKQLLFSLYEMGEIPEYRMLAKRLGIRISFHLRLDFDTSVKGLDRASFDKLKNSYRIGDELMIRGMYAHLYAAYINDLSLFKQDVRKYGEAFAAIPNEVRKQLDLHLYSSCFFDQKVDEAYDMVRIGVQLYGLQIERFGSGEKVPDVLNVLSIRGSVTGISNVKAGAVADYSGRLPSRVKRVALLSLGNWDLPYFFMSDRPQVEIDGHLCRIVGSPCMDNCLADITDIDDIKVGDHVWFLADREGIRFSDWVRSSGLDFGDCQMLLSGIERIPKYYIEEDCDEKER